MPGLGKPGAPLDFQADLPDEGDVRSGVSYDNGNKTGTLVVPAEDNVRYPIGYGEDGTEYEGNIVVPEANPSGDVDPTGPVGKAMLALRNLIAASTTFQDGVGATGTPAERLAYAKTKVYIGPYTPSDGDFDDCYAIVCRAQNDHSGGIADGTFNDNGELELWLIQEKPSSYQAAGQEENAEFYFTNFCDDVVTEAQALSATAGYLITRGWDVIDGPSELKDQENALALKILVGWGLED